MDQVATVQIPVAPDTARALDDPRRLAAVGRLVDRIVRPTSEDDPLAAVLEATSRDAQRSGLTDDEIEAELSAYNAERRQG